MTPTVDTAIDIIRRLPPADREKLREWMDTQGENGSSSNGFTVEMSDRFQKAMKWIDENRAAYLGMWVALDGDRLLASGPDGIEVRAKAMNISDRTPLMHLVSQSEVEPYLGG